MNLAHQIENSRASVEVIQGGASCDQLEGTLSKYDDLVDLLGDNHQLVLNVLEEVPSRDYTVRTTVKQELLDSVFTKGAGLLRLVDRDMLKIASTHGNFEGNAIYSSLGCLRKSISSTIAQYPRMAGDR